MAYTHLFRPDSVDIAASAAGDPGDEEVYVFDDEDVVLSVNVAMATQRPLLVYGAAGSGKSTLAPNIARILGWDFAHHVITSRTEAEDLLWQFDAVERLSDANDGKAKPAAHYYRHGVLWKAFTGGPTVVLIDEIDKADPDLPNGLLAPLGSFAFTSHAGETISAPRDGRPLVVITSNDERELPRPFLRRCVVLALKPPTMEHLLKVATAHFGGNIDFEIVEAAADQVLFEQENAVNHGYPPPSTAEFLDTLRACRRLGIGSDSPEWRHLTMATLVKTAAVRN
ncbi:AAA family ATPase [Amycolatopsis sp. cmx-4-68]|uniref:AAA family ATPase n=1 Tax=Amycolatopsis sp. cmx-4-68 TaxID=2790938 RepID=UPI00397CEF36